MGKGMFVVVSTEADVDLPECGPIINSGVSPCDGGRAPNVNPCPNGVSDGRGLRDPGKLILDPAEGIKGASTSTGTSNS